MMGFKQKLKNTVLRCDIFSCSANLRHRGQPSYETLCGGVFSIMIMTAFIIIFMNSFITVLQKVNISSTTQISDQGSSDYNVDDIFFAIGIKGLDMNAANRYFSIVMKNMRHQNYSQSPISQTQIHLESCKRQNWAAQSTAFQEYYDIYGIDKMLCLKSNQTLSIFGNQGTIVWEYLEVKVQQCFNNSYENPCHPSATINTYITNYLTNNDFFEVSFLLQNKIITPTNSQPVSKVLQRDIFLTFSSVTGSRGIISLGTYSIQTDDSILPFQVNTIQNGHFFQNHETHTITLRSTHYIQFQVVMSTTLHSISRNHGKLDEMLSYVGGLFALLVSFAAFFIASYSQCCYEMSIADCAFDKDKQASEKKFNFFTYILYSIYDYLVFFEIAPKWQRMQKISATKDQACQQMDMRLIIKRLNYYQNLTKVLLDEHQRMSLYMAKMPSLEEIIQMREKLQQFQQLKSNQDGLSQIKQIKQDTQQKIIVKNISLIQNQNQMTIISGKVMNSHQIQYQLNTIVPSENNNFENSINQFKKHEQSINLQEHLRILTLQANNNNNNNNNNNKNIVSKRIYNLVNQHQNYKKKYQKQFFQSTINKKLIYENKNSAK